MRFIRHFTLAMASTCVLFFSSIHAQETQTTDSTASSTNNSTSTQEIHTMVTIKTSMGDIELSLDAENAPKTVENFLSYVSDQHYNGTIFHRVIKGFMIQGGGFEPGMSQKPTKAPVQNEANNGLKNDKYTIAMARTNDPHSATSQFFINAKDNDFLNFSSETPSGWGYTVFGKVTKGQEVIDAIEGVSTGNVGPFGDVPREDVVIESVEVAK